ncbi:MAG: hypothetical protein JXQ27_17365 [Acidobacteria bacterium]|nr:hypothetical protein [Acidobacteriota bacterium]
MGDEIRRTKPSAVWRGLWLVMLIYGGLGVGARADELELSFRSFSYLHNLEFVGEATRYRDGETFFGQHLSLYATYFSAEHFQIRGGIFLGRSFGDDESLDEIRPLITAEYEPNRHFRLTFGNLDREGRLFDEAIFDDILLYQRPLETGMQVNAGTSWFRASYWLNWQALNTDAHREKFDMGSLGVVTRSPFRFDAQFHYIHRGGQQFDSGEVTDDFAVATGVELQRAVGPFAAVSLSGHWYMSHYLLRDNDQRTSGRGVEVRSYLDWRGWQPFITSWWGEDFWTEDGDPFYQADRLWTFGFRKNWLIGRNIQIGLNFTAYHLEGEFQHAASLRLSLAGQKLIPLG